MFTFESPLYFSSIRVVVTKNFAKSLKKLKIKANNTDQYDAFVLTNRKKIWLFVKPNTSFSVLAHEAVHIVNEIFNRASVRLDSHNDEPQAYLMGWVVRELSKIIKIKNE